MRWNNRGAGQFEMVISFVFFVGFVFFLFLFLTPDDTTSLSGAVIDGLQDSFREEVFINMSSFFLKANYVGMADCFLVDLPDNIFDYEIRNEDTHSALLTGAVIASEMEGYGLNMNDEGEFYRVIISDEFDGSDLDSCESYPDYQLGNVIERKVVSYKALETMRDFYNSDYEALRSQLRFPPVYDFSISFEGMSELDMMIDNGPGDSEEVLARDYVFEVLRSDGTLTNERINFRIW